MPKLDATERRALTLCAFTAACICFAPAQIVSGLVLLAVSAALYVWDQQMLKREDSAATAGAQPSTATDRERAQDDPTGPTP